jgi:hypothetical protein
VSIFWGYLRFKLAMFVLRLVGWTLLLTLLTAVLVAAAPITLVAAVGLAGGWLRGWPPSRLWRAAAWSLVMTGVYMVGVAFHAANWRAFALAPVRDWVLAWHAASHGDLVRAFVLCAPAAAPAGLAIAGWLWAWRIYAIETGLSGRLATAPVVFDARQWRRQARAARGRIAAPGTVALTDARSRVVMGATIRAVGHRWRPMMAVPYAAMGRHQVVIGASGSGKTNLMIRSWAGWYAAALQASRERGAPRPLLVVLDCKGGPDSRVKAGRARRLLHAVGARRVAIWPDEAAISLWALPPRELAVVLFQMIDTGTGGAAYYADVTQAVIALAVSAPPGPPTGGGDFLARLDPGWLERAYAGGAHPSELAAVTVGRRHLPDVALRYRTLLGRLGPALDGPGHLTDADAWYFILEGTREPSVAEAQAMALIELVANATTAAGASGPADNYVGVRSLAVSARGSAEPP